MTSKASTEHDELWSILTHPLRLLSLDSDFQPQALTVVPLPSSSTPLGNYGNYVLDADLEYDPVATGLLTLEDFERLHKLCVRSPPFFTHISY